VHGHERIFYGYFGHVGIGKKKKFVGMEILAWNERFSFLLACDFWHGMMG